MKRDLYASALIAATHYYAHTFKHSEVVGGRLSDLTQRN